MELLKELPQNVQQLILSKAIGTAASQGSCTDAEGATRFPEAHRSLWDPRAAVQLHHGMAVFDSFLTEAEFKVCAWCF